jgi:UV DNA damage endonuclease
VRIGYACQTLGVSGAKYRGCTRKNASEAALAALIGQNLQALEHAVEYNIRNGIQLFRLTSDLIPFGSSPINPLAWWDLFAPQFRRIGDRIRLAGMRVSMHPGQYTVLNSPDADVVRRAADDLAYHRQVLDCLGLEREHKIILHIGGVYQDKSSALHRFAAAWQELDDALRQRLVIENDDRCFTVADALAINSQLRIPVVYDNLHHQLNPPDPARDDAYWIACCRETWPVADGWQKIHYAQQDPGKKGGSHSSTIQIRPFLNFCRMLDRDDLDIMLEVKDKNLSARKCLLCLSASRQPRELEIEWSRYKYLVLEHSPQDYLAIRELLKDKQAHPCVAFYEHVDHARQTEITAGQAENAALHVWGYFRNLATEQEKQRFLLHLDQFRQGRESIIPIKRLLLKLAGKYGQDYLTGSYYFLAVQ